MIYLSEKRIIDGPSVHLYISDFLEKVEVTSVAAWHHGFVITDVTPPYSSFKPDNLIEPYNNFSISLGEDLPELCILYMSFGADTGFLLKENASFINVVIIPLDGSNKYTFRHFTTLIDTFKKDSATRYYTDHPTAYISPSGLTKNGPIASNEASMMSFTADYGGSYKAGFDYNLATNASRFTLSSSLADDANHVSAFTIQGQVERAGDLYDIPGKGILLLPQYDLGNGKEITLDAGNGAVKYINVPISLPEETFLGTGLTTVYGSSLEGLGASVGAVLVQIE